MVLVTQSLDLACEIEGVKDGALAGEPVGLLLPAPRERGLERLPHAAPSRARRVERAALDERLERALVHELRVDALAEVPDGREEPALLPRGDDRANGALAHVLHRVQAEAD